MSSHIAGVVNLLQMAFTSPLAMSGIGPVPVPDSVNTAAFPYVTVQEPADYELQSLTGPSGMSKSVIQVSVWSRDYEAAWHLRSQIKSLLLSVAPTTILSLKLQATNQVASDAELYDGPRKLHQLITRIQIWWEE